MMNILVGRCATKKISRTLVDVRMAKRERGSHIKTSWILRHFEPEVGQDVLYVCFEEQHDGDSP